MNKSGPVSHKYLAGGAFIASPRMDEPLSGVPNAAYQEPIIKQTQLVPPMTSNSVTKNCYYASAQSPQFVLDAIKKKIGCGSSHGGAV